MTLPGTVYIFSTQYFKSLAINPFTAKLFNLNCYPPEVVSRWRDPQLQVGEIPVKIIQIWQNGC